MAQGVWTTAEEQYIRKYYPTMKTAAEIAKDIGRGESSVSRKASKMGVKKRSRKNGWCVGNVPTLVTNGNAVGCVTSHQWKGGKRSKEQSWAVGKTLKVIW